MAEAKRKTKKKAGGGQEESSAPPPEAPNIEAPAKKGAPKWVVTFSDLMSLLMCFFIMLLSMSEIDIKKFKAMLEGLDAGLDIKRSALVVRKASQSVEAQQTLRARKQTVADTIKLMRLLKPLIQAKQISFFGLGASGPVAMDAQHKFFRLKIPSSYISDPHIQFMSANSLGDKDVVVAISQSGTTSALIDSVNIVRKSGVRVIGIMPANTPLANICDLPLSIDVGDNNRLSKPHTSRIAYTAVIDAMTMGVAQLKPEAQEHLYNIADSQRSLRVK